MNLEIKKRITTSIFLIILLILMFIYNFVLVTSLILIAIISWVEFIGLIIRIFKKKKNKNIFLKFFYKAISLIYISSLVYLIIDTQIDNSNSNIIIIYSILISIMSDIGGLVVGKTIKGKKLTKISPKKTISGSVGSFIFSLLLIPFFIGKFLDYNFVQLIIITIIISLVSQIGDLFISFLKRKAKVKDTSDLLPGHGGILDRIDGIIFAIPTGFILFVNF
jgi:phosphatidate cytidylyltransferase